ncbi:hypothetical protein INT43_007756, partial [Umbelopsis isabellina]
MSIKKNGGDEKVKVVCRVRPFLDHEAPDDSVVVEDNEIKITNQRNTTEIVFSSCHGPESKQSDIYEQDVQPLVDKVFAGVDSTIFAYGVTGSGKTHTMQGTPDEPGIIPRVAQYLFDRVSDYPRHSVSIHVSYMEIYKELVYDLLIPRDGQGAGLSIREDSLRNIFVANLTDKEIKSFNEFETVYNNACKNRSTAETKMNVSSSRSHAILSLQVIVATGDHQHLEGENDEDESGRYALTGKINLIDLAGSEDNRRTDNGKERLAESGAINKSLFVLGQVVESINTASVRIPFRDSKMTRILQVRANEDAVIQRWHILILLLRQPSLGGKAQGMMIVNIAPGQSFFMDSYNRAYCSSLSFATKSKTIENIPVVNTILQEEPPTPTVINNPSSLGQALRVAINGRKRQSRKRLSDSMFDRPAKRRLQDSYRWPASPGRGMLVGDRMSYYSRLLRPKKRMALTYDTWPKKKLMEEQLETRLEERMNELVNDKISELQRVNSELRSQVQEQKNQTLEVLQRLQAIEAKLAERSDRLHVASHWVGKHVLIKCVLSYQYADIDTKIRANSGIGYSTSCVLACLGANVHICVRSRSKADETIKGIVQYVHEHAADQASTVEQRLSSHVVEMSDFASVRSLCKEIQFPIDILINNAGLQSKEKQMSNDGYELTWQNSHRQLHRQQRCFTVLSLAQKESGFEAPPWDGFEERPTPDEAAYPILVCIIDDNITPGALVAVPDGRHGQK